MLEKFSQLFLIIVILYSEFAGVSVPRGPHVEGGVQGLTIQTEDDSNENGNGQRIELPIRRCSIGCQSAEGI